MWSILLKYIFTTSINAITATVTATFFAFCAVAAADVTDPITTAAAAVCVAASSVDEATAAAAVAAAAAAATAAAVAVFAAVVAPAGLEV